MCVCVGGGGGGGGGGKQTGVLGKLGLEETDETRRHYMHEEQALYLRHVILQLNSCVLKKEE